MKLTRRDFAAGLAVGITAPYVIGSAARAQGATIKIGMCVPVTGTHMPISIVAPCARAALPITYGAVIPTAKPAAKSRLVSFISFSLRPGFFVGLSWYWLPVCRTRNRLRIYGLLARE